MAGTFSIVVFIFLVVWIISEVMIYKSIKNRKNDESIWLVMNILLPIVGCIVYN